MAAAKKTQTTTTATAKKTQTRKPSRTVTVTAKADVTVPRGLQTATINAFTLKGNVHRQRADVIRRIRNLKAGISVRGAVAVMTVALEGHTPDGFSAASVGRYYVVIDALATLTEKGISFDTLPLADRDQVVADLYRIAGPGGGKDAVTKATAEIVQRGAELALIVLGQHKATVARNQLAAVTRKPNRPVGGEAADGGKQAPAAVTGTTTSDTATNTAGEPTAAQTEPIPTGTPERPTRDALALITELTRVVSSSSFVPSEVIITAFDQLAEAFEQATETANV